jgi:hypothetical protein
MDSDAAANTGNRLSRYKKGIMGAENPLSLFLIQEKKDKGFFKALIDL